MIASSKWNCSLRNNQVKIPHDRSVSMSAFSWWVAVTYEVEVHTGEEQEKPLDSPAYIQIFGVTTNTPKLFLESKTAAFTKDSKSKFSIPSNNVGAVRRCSLMLIILQAFAFSLDTTYRCWSRRSWSSEWLVFESNQNPRVQSRRKRRVRLIRTISTSSSLIWSAQSRYTVDQWLSPVKGNQQLFVELSRQQPPTRSPRGKPSMLSRGSSPYAWVLFSNIHLFHPHSNSWCSSNANDRQCGDDCTWIRWTNHEVSIARTCQGEQRRPFPTRKSRWIRSGTSEYWQCNLAA